MNYKDEREDMAHAEGEGLLTPNAPRKPLWRRNCTTWAVALFLLAWTCMLAQWTTVILGPAAPCSGREVAWSPVIDDVPVQRTRYNVTFRYPSMFPSKYSFGKESDSNWRAWSAHPLLSGRNGTLAVGSEIVDQLAGQYEPEWRDSLVKIDDGGQGKFMAQLEINHHVHCLDQLRHAVRADSSSNTPAIGHLEHCIETLREVLMCNAGTGLIMFHWMADHDEPYPDYNTFHQCRNADAVLEWMLDHAVSYDSVPKKRGEDFALQRPPY